MNLNAFFFLYFVLLFHLEKTSSAGRHLCTCLFNLAMHFIKQLLLTVLKGRLIIP